ncbi:MAG: hypothetical protein Q9170_004371 [Blastenia crenularia]
MARRGRIQRPFSETAFGNIAGELRDKIYRLALTVPTGNKPGMHPYVFLQHQFPGWNFRKDGLLWYSEKYHHYKTRPEKWLGVLQTCKQIHQEAVHIFYLVNAIAFATTDSLVELSLMCPDRCTLLTSIHLDYMEGDAGRTFKWLAKCTNLRHLSLRFRDARPERNADHVWLDACHQDPATLKYLDRVRGLQSVRFVNECSKYRHEPMDCEEFAPCELSEFTWYAGEICQAKKVRSFMLRPKVIADIIPEQTQSLETVRPKSTANNLTQKGADSEEKKSEHGMPLLGPLKRKRERTSGLNAGIVNSQAPDTGCKTSEDNARDVEKGAEDAEGDEEPEAKKNPSVAHVGRIDLDYTSEGPSHDGLWRKAAVAAAVEILY